MKVPQEDIDRLQTKGKEMTLQEEAEDTLHYVLTAKNIKKSDDYCVRAIVDLVETWCMKERERCAEIAEDYNRPVYGIAGRLTASAISEDIKAKRLIQSLGESETPELKEEKSEALNTPNFALVDECPNCGETRAWNFINNKVIIQDKVIMDENKVIMDGCEHCYNEALAWAMKQAQIKKN